MQCLCYYRWTTCSSISLIKRFSRFFSDHGGLEDSLIVFFKIFKAHRPASVGNRNRGSQYAY